MTRTRLRNELNKGVEALRHEDVALLNLVGNNATYLGIIGPFEVDVDIKSVSFVSGVLAVDDVGNTLDVFKGTVAASVEIVAQVNPDNANGGYSNQVPADLPVISPRVPAGTPITVQLVAAGDNSATPHDLTVRVGYDIVIHELGAKSTTYSGYDDGQ